MKMINDGENSAKTGTPSGSLAHTGGGMADDEKTAYINGEVGNIMNFVSTVLLHETGHHGAAQNNMPDSAAAGSTMERGDMLEMAVNGQTATRHNSGHVVYSHHEVVSSKYDFSFCEEMNPKSRIHNQNYSIF